ncbi:hypothetical protein [Kitasatospora sp. NPDC091207]
MGGSVIALVAAGSADAVAGSVTEAFRATGHAEPASGARKLS